MKKIGTMRNSKKRLTCISTLTAKIQISIDNAIS